MRQLLLLAVCAVSAPSALAEGPSFLSRSMAEWSQDLADTRPAVRRSAAFALGRIGSDALVKAPALAKALHDSDPSVRAMAAEALGDIALALHGGGLSVWDAAGPVLGKALTDEADPSVRRAAAYALGTFRDRAEALLPELRNALHDSDAGVRRQAARALGRLGEAAGAAVKDLSDLVNDSDVLVRRNAVTALGSIGLPAARPAVRPMLDLLKRESDGVVRRAALHELVGLVGAADRSVASEFYPLLSGDDPEAAFSAAFILANMGGPDAAPALPLLRKTLLEEDEQLQALAAAALGAMGVDAAPAVPELAQALTESKDVTVRTNVALALSILGPKANKALNPLIAALSPSEAQPVRMYASEAIKNIGTPENDPAVPALLAVVASDADPTVRHHCAWCVAQRRDYESNGIAKVFSKVIEETDPAAIALRYEAALHLANHLHSKAPDKTVDIMLELFRDKDVKPYSGTAVKVSNSGGEASAGKAELTEKRSSTNFNSQVLAARALGWLGAKANRPEVIAALRAALKEDDPVLRKAISEALLQIQP
jgi:HEAT repeat protein